MDMPLSYEYYSSVNAKPVEWLWYPYIPYGKITLLQGDPGEGKSTLVLHLAAIMTQGGVLPDGQEAETPQVVIYQCSEDNKEDTIKPRLMQAGADCSKVAFIVEDQDSLTLDDERIETVIKRTGARLFVLDPIQAYICQEGDMQSATRMRSKMQRLAAVAERNQCAVLLVGHLNKSGSGKTLYRGLGSIDIAAIARSVLLVTREETYPDIRYMVPVKTSLAHESHSIGFIMDPELGFRWIGKCAGQHSNNESGMVFGKKEKAMAIIKALLLSGPIKSTELIQRMRDLQISERTMRTAEKALGVEAFQKHKAWYLQLPPQSGMNENE